MEIVYDPAEYPVAAVRRLAESGGEGNVAVPLEWGGYALWHLAPRVKVSLDGRFATVYPHEVVERNFAFYSGRDDWQRLIELHRTDAVLAWTRALPPIRSVPGWRVAYGDPVATLIVREGGPFEGVSGGAAVVEPAGVFP
jgi:hypothetical protein